MDTVSATEKKMPEEHGEPYRQHLARVTGAVAKYDGTETTYQEVMGSLSAMEQWMVGVF